jgi:hypothetical protein
MWLNEFLQCIVNRPQRRRPARARVEQRNSVRLTLEPLEDRTVLSGGYVHGVLAPSTQSSPQTLSTTTSTDHSAASNGRVIFDAGVGNGFHDNGKGGKGSAGFGGVMLLDGIGNGFHDNGKGGKGSAGTGDFI